MPAKKYRVKLTTDEREYLKQILSKGKASARKRTHAQILLHADNGVTNNQLRVCFRASHLRMKNLLTERWRENQSIFKVKNHKKI